MEWLRYQKDYYKESGSHRSPQLWASKCIRAIHTFTWNIWNDRNTQLHHTDRIKEMEGRFPLEIAIRREWYIGLGRLPASEFAYLLSGSIDRLLESSLPSMRRWLAVIRNGRILLDKDNVISDEFMTNESLRKWVGIIKTEEGRPIFSQDNQDG